MVQQLIAEHDYQLKFVVDRPEDAEEVLEYLSRLQQQCAGSGQVVDSGRVMLMPQGTDLETLQRQEEWLLPWCRSHDFRYCPRSHILWYGNRRGT